ALGSTCALLATCFGPLMEKTGRFSMRKSSRLVFSLIIACLTTSLVRSQPTATPMQKGGSAKSPLSPEEAVKHFKIAPGLRIELAAAEPLVQSPVAIAFDANGRLWVVEMPDYPNGPPMGKPPEGRIRVLEDKKGDG